jgi:hypothetical protein
MEIFSKSTKLSELQVSPDYDYSFRQYDLVNRHYGFSFRDNDFSFRRYEIASCNYDLSFLCFNIYPKSLKCFTQWPKLKYAKKKIINYYFTWRAYIIPELVEGNLCLNGN